MRRSIFIIGLSLLAMAGLTIYAERYWRGGGDKAATNTIEQVLRAQTASILPKIEVLLNKSERDAGSILNRSKKRAQLRTYYSDTMLAEPEAAKWAIAAGRRVRSAAVSANPLLEDALERHLLNKSRLDVFSQDGKSYLFVNGMIEGQPYALAYDPTAFFAALRSVDGIRIWLVQKDGTILFHPIARFIGSNASNLRPIAIGMESAQTVARTFFLEKYMGIDGKDAVGVWSSLPTMKLLVGAEWSKPLNNPSASLWWIFFPLSVVGAALVGFSFSRNTSEPIRQEEPDYKEFQESPVTIVSDEAADEYAANAKREMERAYAHARRIEQEADQIDQKYLQAVGNFRSSKWKLDTLEEFIASVLMEDTGKQVWHTLSAMIGRKIPANVIFYRYAPSSFSLVPDSVHGGRAMSVNAKTFLTETRIFIGNPSLIRSTVQTEAFIRWNRAREKVMPNEQKEFRAYPIENGSTLEGLILVMFDQDANASSELEASFQLVEYLVNTTSTFCSRHGSLLQLNNAKSGASKAMASSSNNIRT